MKELLASPQFLAGAIGALASFLGVVIGQFVTARMAKIQAERTERLEAQRAEREQAVRRDLSAEKSVERELQAQEQRARELLARREEFFGLVLLVQELLGSRMDKTRAEKKSSAPSAYETGSAAARRAYAVATLYLSADLRDLAKDFYRATISVDLALDMENQSNLRAEIEKWLPLFGQIESHFLKGDLQA